MIWSLIKGLLFIVIIGALALGAGYLMQTGTELHVAIGGWEFSLGPVQAVIAALVLIAAVWLLIRLVALLVATLRFLNGDETALSRYFTRNRERRGYEALSDSLMALASGEGRLALARAKKAEKFLQRPELTTLIAAQAAELAGDTRRAAEAYKRLLPDERTRFVGVRGILMQKLAEGDTATALKLAEHAYALKPRHEEVQDILLRLQAGEGDWKGARTTLGAKLRTGALPRDVHRRRDAALALQEARGILDEGNSIEAREAAIAANRESPDLIPAAAMAARAYIANARPKYATRVLIKAWEAQPHPDLAAAFAEIEPLEFADRTVAAVPRADLCATTGRGNPAAAGRTEHRGRGFSGGPACAGRSAGQPSDGARADDHGGDRARRRIGRGCRARLARQGRDRLTRAAVDLRQVQHHPCRMGAGL